MPAHRLTPDPFTAINPTMTTAPQLPDYLPDYAKSDLADTVDRALKEDIGDGDITALLIPATVTAAGQVITREDAVTCGQAWVEHVFRQVDPAVEIQWQIPEGARAEPGQVLFDINGPARALLTGERAALNFLQLLSGTATTCRHYADLVAGTGVKLLDTRKTLPGLRNAQKYAVTRGGCFNHRIGLYDAFLIKENHIATCGGIGNAVRAARAIGNGKPVEVEVENRDELDQAIEAGADIIMLDNFSIAELGRAVSINAGRSRLEASGNVTRETLREIAETGVDYISIGALTKHLRAIDLSMRITRFSAA